MFIFIDIENYEGVYGINRRGDVRNNKTGRILKSNYGQPYAYVTPSKNNKAKRLNIHRAVAIAFIPNPENKETVNHINGIKHDNNVTNLEWATRGENEKHAWATGLNHAAANRGHTGVLEVILSKIAPTDTPPNQPSR